jgi:hypothetical protein
VCWRGTPKAICLSKFIALVHSNMICGPKCYASGERARTPLPGGRQITTLEDAARYIQRLPKAEQVVGQFDCGGYALENG